MKIKLSLNNCCFYQCSECIQKFGPSLGEEVWGAVNAIFDVLPLAAIIDNKVKEPLVQTLDNNACTMMM